MAAFLKELTGGLVLILVASLIGVGVNTVRPSGLQLIQRVEAVQTAVHGEDGDPAGETHVAEGAVTLEEMKRIYDEGVVVIIDARSPTEYKEGHIPGAVNIPYDQLPAYMETLQLEAPMGTSVVCYCRGPSCDFSDHLATELKLMGYDDVSVFTGGWEHWTEAGNPAEGGGE